MSGWLAKAEQLLEKADRKAGERIEKVKERAGMQQRGSKDDLQEDLQDVQISAAAMALLEKNRGRAPSATEGSVDVRESIDATASPQAEGNGVLAEVEGSGASVASLEASQQRRARLSEWEALGQEIQILSTHGRKLQQRLLASASEMERVKASEALVRSQLQDAIAASAAAAKAKTSAEHAVDAARGTQQTARSQAEARLAHSEETAAALQAQIDRLHHELLVARKNEATVIERQQAKLWPAHHTGGQLRRPVLSTHRPHRCFFISNTHQTAT